MASPRDETPLDLPKPAGPFAGIPLPEGGLVRPGRATPAPVVLSGTRARLRASGLGGIEAVEGDGATLAGTIRLGAPPAANVLVTPRSLTRERVGAEGTLRETVLVPERLPGVVVQWSGLLTGEADLEVDLPGAAGTGARIRIEGRLLRWARPGDEGGAVIQLDGPAEGPGWALERDGPGVRARVRPRPAPGEPVTLLVAAVPPDGRLPSLAALGAVAAHRRRDELEPGDAPGLRFVTGVGDLDEGVAWARAALRARLEERPGAPPGIRGGGDATLVRGALAAGELDVARAALSSSPRGLADAEARAAWVAWTGRPEPLLEARPWLEALLTEAPDGVRRRVADAAEAVGETDWAAALRRPRGSTRTLPTLGPRTTSTSPDPGAPPMAPTAGDGPLSDALAALRSTDPDPGLMVLRRTLAAFAREGPPPESPDAPLLLELLVLGLLGVEPDAAYGRIRVAPCVPASWTSFRVDGLRVGDAVLEVEMRREGGLHRFALRQTAGGAPVTWIFAPRLPGRILLAARVDGEPAALEAVPAGSRIQPRVQIPAERERIVEFETGSVSPP